MGLGPRLDIRVSQSLVMSQQLQAAIKLLALSNLEIEAVIAEELAKNPLLEARPSEGGASGESVIVRDDRETGDEARDPTGSDELIGHLGGTDDSPLDMDWREAALDTDSFADVGAGGGGSDEAFDFDRLEACESGPVRTSAWRNSTARAAPSGAPPRRSSTSWRRPAISTRRSPIIAEATGATTKEAAAALALVQSLDPPGIAARNLEECIALQAKAADRYDPAMARLIANLDLLAKGRMADLKRICGVDDEDLADMVRELARLRSQARLPLRHQGARGDRRRRLRPPHQGRLVGRAQQCRACRGSCSTAATTPN